MTSSGNAGVVRRTQTQRSADMRARLLDATVECLVEYGYAGTSTHRVVELAGVTRGAQVHHFRSKEDLVIAAIEHLAEQRTQAAIREIARVKANADPVSAALEYIWESHQGPIFAATVELWIAARTDPALAQQVERVEPIVNGALVGAIAQLLPEQVAQKELRDIIYTAMDALRGILVSSFGDPEPHRARRRWDRVCAHIRILLLDTLGTDRLS
jgi:AcrR family transcriptional regulator